MMNRLSKAKFARHGLLRMREWGFASPRFILSLFLLILAMGATTFAQVTVDGTLNTSEGYGSALAAQTINTGFGDNTSSAGTSSGGSELDAIYGVVTNGYLYLFVAGNLQANGNNINVFVASGVSNGQQVLQIGGSSLEAAMNGSTFSSGFKPSFMFTFTNNATTLSVDQAVLTGSSGTESHLGNVTLASGIGNSQNIGGTGIAVGFNNQNVAGVNGSSGTAASQSSASAVNQGLELAIPLSLLGNPTNSIQVMVDINGNGFAYLSNQFIPGLPAGTGNVGGGGSYGSGGVFNFGSTTGEYVTVPLPASAFGTPVLSVNGINADYGMTHVFVNEISNDAVPLTILFSPNASNVVEADVFSNLNRRDHANLDANGDGIEDGILPPNGNLIATGDTNNYYEAYAMSPTGTAGQYSLALNAQKTGVYRLTARYKVSGNTNWFWYSTNAPYTTGNRRDFSVVVSPKKATSAVIYELSVGILNATGSGSSQRSFFSSLTNSSSRFNLNYFTNLGVNWLWLEPIYPIGVVSTVNSPWCVKNFFQVSPLMGAANTRAESMTEFQNFVATADAAGVNVMMDIPFDHTARDCELDAEGVADFGGAGNPGNWQPTGLIPNLVPQFYELTNAWCSRATASNNVALAPDIDISKWSDVYDVFKGVSASLVCSNPANDSNESSPDDWFDYSTSPGNFDHTTQSVWRYDANCLLYWLTQTGCTNGTPAGQTAAGVDGIRADFADGLPPQMWEYIINTVRCRKWDFVFLAESLSWPPPSAPTYRSGRDFDILCDSVYNGFQTASSATDYQTIFNSERSAYGQCLNLWNAASHDAGFYYTDPYQALIRFMVAGTIDGMPHVFYGQELGTTESFGFSVYAGDVPSFYNYNSLQPAITAAAGNLRVDRLYPLYSAVAKARQSSPALQSANRYFLNPTVAQPNIFAVAKFTSTNGAPNFSDVEFAFVNLDVSNSHQATFSVNISQNASNLFGIQPARLYNVKNIGAYTGADANRAKAWVWNTNGIAGSNLLANGINITLNAVPTTAAGWTNSPFEAQYLKLYDVTAPATLAAPTTKGFYVVTNVVTFTWLPLNDPNAGVSGYQVIVGTSPGASDVFNGIVQGTSLSVTNTYGTTLYAEVAAVSVAGIAGSFSASSSGVVLVDPTWIPVLSMQGSNLLKWTSVSGKTYQVWSTTNLSVPFTPIGSPITAQGPISQNTNNSPDPTRFYRVQVFP